MADGGKTVLIEEATLDEIWHAAAPLLSAHYEEVAKFKEIAVLKPDYERYKQAECSNRFLALLVRVEGEVIGYSANFHAASLHYADLNVYQNDVIYLAPEHRGGRLGLALIYKTIEHIRTRWGPGLMVWHAKEATPLNTLLPRLGYEILDVLWAKAI
jgi:GNAT superfamily N-acetyltransferase